MPAGVDLAAAAHVTLGAVSIEALRRTECRFGETVAIFGSGMLGLLIAQLAASAGVYVVALDTEHGTARAGRAGSARRDADRRPARRAPVYAA